MGTAREHYFRTTLREKWQNPLLRAQGREAAANLESATGEYTVDF